MSEPMVKIKVYQKLQAENKALEEEVQFLFRNLKRTQGNLERVQQIREELLEVIDRVIRYVPVASEIARDCKSVYVKARIQGQDP